jgi:hypothetical protein
VVSEQLNVSGRMPGLFFRRSGFGNFKFPNPLSWAAGLSAVVPRRPEMSTVILKQAQTIFLPAARRPYFTQSAALYGFF